MQLFVTASQVEESSHPFSDFLFPISGLGVPIWKVLLPKTNGYIASVIYRARFPCANVQMHFTANYTLW